MIALLAGPQHACAIALNLGMRKVFIHKYGGILSAYGLSMADAVTEEQEAAADLYATFDSKTDDYMVNVELYESEKFQRLEARAINSLVEQGYDKDNVNLERFVVRSLKVIRVKLKKTNLMNHLFASLITESSFSRH